MGKDGEVNYRRLCMHCQDPTCASVCPVGALHKTAAGPVVYNARDLPGLPLLHPGLPVQRFRSTSGRPDAAGPQVQLLRGPPGPGQDQRLRRSLPVSAPPSPATATPCSRRPGRGWPPSPASTCPRFTASTMPAEPPCSSFPRFRSPRWDCRRTCPPSRMPMLTFRVLSKIPPLVAVGASVLTGLWWFTRRKKRWRSPRRGGRKRRAAAPGRRTRRRTRCGTWPGWCGPAAARPVAQDEGPDRDRRRRARGIRREQVRRSSGASSPWSSWSGGAYGTWVRFTQGLGASTHLNDHAPWGLWIGFDILCGVGLAAGGFTITTAVYILHLEQLRPIVRPTILTAFLGYLLVVVRADGRPGPPLEHLARHGLVESALGDVRGGLVRDALQHRAGAGVLAHALRAAEVARAPCGSSGASWSRWWAWASCSPRCTSPRSAAST